MEEIQGAGILLNYQSAIYEDEGPCLPARCSQGMKSELSLAGGSGPASSKLNRIVVRRTVLKSYRNSKSHGLQVAV